MLSEQKRNLLTSEFNKEDLGDETTFRQKNEEQELDEKYEINQSDV